MPRRRGSSAERRKTPGLACPKWAAGTDVTGESTANHEKSRILPGLRSLAPPRLTATAASGTRARGVSSLVKKQTMRGPGYFLVYGVWPLRDLRPLPQAELGPEEFL